jgi:pimeloyl-ACP methyl ester carboxylesterase
VPTRIFIHGLESGNQGTKSVYFRGRYPDMIIPHFTGDLDERMENLATALEGKSDVRVVGSSFGGLMAALFALGAPERAHSLVLLAPALNLMDSSMIDGRSIDRPVRVWHGTRDAVIPLDRVRPIAETLFTRLTFHAVDDDHFLHNTFKGIDWDTLLA